MNRQKSVCFIGMISLPYCAFAHGEEVLSTILYAVIPILVFLGWLIFLKFRLADKLRLIAVYALAFSSIVFFTKHLPYHQNRTFLYIAFAFGPAAAC